MIGENKHIDFIKVGNSDRSLVDLPTEVLETRMVTWEEQRRLGEKALMNSEAVIGPCKTELIARGVLVGEVEYIQQRLFILEDSEPLPLF